MQSCLEDSSNALSSSIKNNCLNCRRSFILHQQLKESNKDISFLSHIHGLFSEQQLSSLSPSNSIQNPFSHHPHFPHPSHHYNKIQPHILLKEIISYLNTNSGVIYLGIDPQSRIVEGIQMNKQSIKKFIMEQIIYEVKQKIYPKIDIGVGVGIGVEIVNSKNDKNDNDNNNNNSKDIDIHFIPVFETNKYDKQNVFFKEQQQRQQHDKNKQLFTTTTITNNPFKTSFPQYFYGKHIIKIIIKQRNPQRLYCTYVKYQIKEEIQEKNKKNKNINNDQVIHSSSSASSTSFIRQPIAYRRCHNLSGSSQIQQIKHEKLLKQIYQRVVFQSSPAALCQKEFHFGCNPLPLIPVAEDLQNVFQKIKNDQLEKQIKDQTKKKKKKKKEKYNSKLQQQQKQQQKQKEQIILLSSKTKQQSNQYNNYISIPPPPLVQNKYTTTVVAQTSSPFPSPSSCFLTNNNNKPSITVTNIDYQYYDSLLKFFKFNVVSNVSKQFIKDEYRQSIKIYFLKQSEKEQFMQQIISEKVSLVLKKFSKKKGQTLIFINNNDENKKQKKYNNKDNKDNKDNISNIINNNNNNKQNKQNVINIMTNNNNNDDDKNYQIEKYQIYRYALTFENCQDKFRKSLINYIQNSMNPKIHRKVIELKNKSNKNGENKNGFHYQNTNNYKIQILFLSKDQMNDFYKLCNQKVHYCQLNQYAYKDKEKSVGGIKIFLSQLLSNNNYDKQYQQKGKLQRKQSYIHCNDNNNDNYNYDNQYYEKHNNKINNNKIGNQSTFSLLATNINPKEHNTLLNYFKNNMFYNIQRIVISSQKKYWVRLDFLTKRDANKFLSKCKQIEIHFNTLAQYTITNTPLRIGYPSEKLIIAPFRKRFKDLIKARILKVLGHGVIKSSQVINCDDENKQLLKGCSTGLTGSMWVLKLINAKDTYLKAYEDLEQNFQRQALYVDGKMVNLKIYVDFEQNEDVNVDVDGVGIGVEV